MSAKEEENLWKTVFKDIAENLIQNRAELSDLKVSNVKIGYLESDKAKKTGRTHLVYGECIKVKDADKWCNPYDFLIVIYQPNVLYSDFDEKQLEILIFHELLHIEIGVDKAGEEVYRIRKHDIEDFRLVTDEYGLDWAEKKEDEAE